MDRQEGQATRSAEGCLSESQKREQRALLIKALSRFKPSDANPQQFYNCVRELCIIHNCSIDEGLERAAVTWPGLSQLQREAYDSQRHAELPIPVPRHLLYHAFQKQRTGLWSLGRSSAKGSHSTRYTLESYKPPPKPSRIQTQLQQKRPKYDNRLDLPPKVAAMHVPTQGKQKFSRPSPSSMRRIRRLTPAAMHSVRSIRQIMPIVDIKITKKTARRSLQKKLEKLCAPKCATGSVESGGSNGSQKKKFNKRKGSKPKTSAKPENLGVVADEPNWEETIDCVRKRLILGINREYV